MNTPWLMVAILWLVTGLTQPGAEAFAWFSIVFFLLAMEDK